MIQTLPSPTCTSSSLHIHDSLTSQATSLIRLPTTPSVNLHPWPEYPHHQPIFIFQVTFLMRLPCYTIFLNAQTTPIFFLVFHLKPYCRVTGSEIRWIFTSLPYVIFSFLFTVFFFSVPCSLPWPTFSRWAERETCCPLQGAISKNISGAQARSNRNTSSCQQRGTLSTTLFIVNSILEPLVF